MMRVAVIDVGSNTARLLVAEASPDRPVPVHEEKAYLRLGAEIAERGMIGPEKLAEAAAVAEEYVAIARKHGADLIEVFVTAPGRQAANGEELLHELASVTRTPARILSAEEEGLLAYQGALSRASRLSGSVAVVDVGGGSTEMVVGAPPDPPSWVRSVDIGALVLSARFLPSDPPTRKEVAAARAAVAHRFDGIVPPRPHRALAVGGSARGLAALVGPEFSPDDLTTALRIATSRPAAKLAKAFRLDRERARVLPGGAIVLAEVVRRLGIPLELARGGVREGAVASLLAEALAA